MSNETLVQLRLRNGRYEGLLTSSAPSDVEVVHGGTVVAMASVTPDKERAGAFHVTADLPSSVLNEGVQVISLRSVGTGEVLDRVTLMSGNVLDEDFRAELALLRAELEMLKRAFRRHCSETAQD